MSISKLSFAILLATIAPTIVTSQQPAAAKIDTVAPSDATETPFSFTSGNLTLPGTLTMPANVKGALPVALIVAGSGPTDRNGNSAGPLKAANNSNIYAIMAWQLAQHGIASVRYDKRVIGDNLGRVDVPSLTIDDFIADVSAGAHALSQDRRFNEVILIGHSEGAELVLQAVNRGAPAKGIVMMSGAGRPMMTIIREQLSKQLPAAELVKWDSASARYLRGEEPGDIFPPLRALLAPQNRKFMQSWSHYDPVGEISRVKVPVLLVQGGRDIQVSEVDARALAAAQPRAKLVVIPNANHVYRAIDTDDRMAQAKLYVDPTLPLVPELVPAIVDWIHGL